jgi:hypothetical protein
MDDSIDLVDICLPPHLHAEIAIAALDAGKHVICENRSPAAWPRRMRSGQRPRDLAASSFRCFSIGTARLLRAGCHGAEGLTGPPVVASLETHWNRDRITTPCRGAAHGRVRLVARSSGTRSTPMTCFAATFGPVASVQAQLGTLVNRIETEDCAAISMRFENGALATSSVTLGAARDETRLRFVFRDLDRDQRAEPYAPAMGAWQFEARAGCAARSRQYRRGSCRGTVGLCRVSRGRGGPYGRQDVRRGALADGRASIELVTAIYHAARTGRPGDAAADGGAPLWQGWLPEGIA